MKECWVTEPLHFEIPEPKDNEFLKDNNQTDENHHNFYPFSGNPHKHWLYRQRHCEVSVFFCPFSVKLCTLCIR